MAKLINATTNALEDVPQDELAKAFLSGTHNLPSNKRVSLNDPDGNPVNVDAKDVYEAVTRGGYKFPSSDELKEATLQSQYGEGLGNELKAAATGAISTIPGALPAAVGLGVVTPDAAKERAKRNPISSTIGEVGGIGAQLALAPELSPVGLIAKGGEAVTGAARGLLGVGEGASSLASKILSNAATKSLGLATEGAAYGTNNVVNEAVLGDPELTAQKALGEIGLSGLMGGTLGGILGAGEVAVPAAVDAAKSALGKVSDLGSQAFAKASSFVSGKPEEDIMGALRNRGETLLSPNERTQSAKEFAGALNDQYSSVEKALKETFRDIRPEESERLVTNVSPELAHAEFQRVYGLVDGTIKDMQARPELYPGRFPSKLQDVRDALTRDVTTESQPSDIYKALNELKQNLDTKIPFGKIPSDESVDAINAIKGLRSDVKASLENEKVFGHAGARQSEFNSAASEYLNAKKEFQKRFMYKTSGKSGGVVYKIDPSKVNSFFNQVADPRGELRSQVLSDFMDSSKQLLGQIEKSYSTLPDKSFDKSAIQSILDKNAGVQSKALHEAQVTNALRSLSPQTGGIVAEAALAGVGHAAGLHTGPLAGAVAGYDMLRNPGLTIQRLAKLERMAQKTTQKIEAGAKALFRASKAPAQGLASVSPELSHAFLSGHSGPGFDGQSQELRMWAQNPETLIDKMHEATAPLYAHAPDTASGIQAAAMSAIGYLNSKLPKPPEPKPMSAPWQPSRSDIAQFNRHVAVVENPTVVFKQMKSGQLTHESVETLQVVYPKLYQQMQSAVMESLTNQKARVPYRTRMMLSLFMGQDLDGSLNAQSIASNQLTINGASQKNPQNETEGPMKTRPSGVAKITLSNRALTPMQAITHRARS